MKPPPKPPTPPRTTDEIPIKIDWRHEPPPVYANGAQIVHTHRDFAVTFTDFAAFEGRGAEAGEAHPRARVVASLRMTPDVFFQLAAACASNWNRFVERFGDERVGAPTFKIEGVEPPGQAPGADEG